MATYDRPGLELQAARVSALSLRLIKISERLVCSIELVHDHILAAHG